MQQSLLGCPPWNTATERFGTGPMRARCRNRRENVFEPSCARRERTVADERARRFRGDFNRPRQVYTNVQSFKIFEYRDDGILNNTLFVIMNKNIIFFR